MTVLLLVFAVGCTNYIRPPESVQDPVTIAVVDHGSHSSLVLPAGEQRSVVYVYGEWNYYAKGNNAWYNMFPAAFWPTQGTLGRRFIETTPGSDQLRTLLPGEETIRLTVEKEQLEPFLERMNNRYQKRRQDPLKNEAYQFSFVQDPDSYHLFNNCNHAVSRWLEQLGCDVRGTGIFARFEL